MCCGDSGIMSGIAVGRIIFYNGKLNLFKRKEQIFPFLHNRYISGKEVFHQYEFEGVFDN